MGTPIPIQRAVLVVLRHLDGLLLRDRAALLHAAADPGVHDVSPCRETGFPAVLLLPFEAFPPPTAAVSGTNPVPRGPASPRRPSPIVAFTANLALSSFLSHRYCGSVSRAVSRCGAVRPIIRMSAWTPRPCSIVGSVAHPDVSVRTRPVLPWAWLVRPCVGPFEPTRPIPCPRTGPERIARSEDHTNERPTSRQRPLRRALSSV